MHYRIRSGFHKAFIKLAFFLPLLYSLLNSLVYECSLFTYSVVIFSRALISYDFRHSIFSFFNVAIKYQQVHVLKFIDWREFIALRRKLPMVIEKRLVKEQRRFFSIYLGVRNIFPSRTNFVQKGQQLRETYYLATLRSPPINRKSRISSVTNLLRQTIITHLRLLLFGGSSSGPAGKAP